jgi:hypothetical protein
MAHYFFDKDVRMDWDSKLSYNRQWIEKMDGQNSNTWIFLVVTVSVGAVCTKSSCSITVQYKDPSLYMWLHLIDRLSFSFHIGTLELCKVIETFSPNTMVFHQLYKRVWPSSQRETLFMSHIREIPSSDVSLERLEYEVGNPWLSINYSIDHPDIPVSFR